METKIPKKATLRTKTPHSEELQTFVEKLVAAGYKITQPRIAVLQAALAHKGAFTVADLEQWLIQRGESPGIASIFRTVKLLTDLRIFDRLHGLDECHRYSFGSEHSHHLLCTNCGTLVSFDTCTVQDVIRQLEQRTGFQITNHLVELFGRCPSCVAPQAATAN
jgi:Fur family ferric uptake transcriptional regulator